MYVYLVRHGEAKSEDADPQRHLTEAGAGDIEKLADFFKHLDIDVDGIYHSGKARARQTAEILARSVESADGVEERDDIGPTDAVEPMARQLIEEDRDVMLVGHLPFMARLAGVLMDGREDCVKFHAGAVVCMHYGEKHGWRLWWSMAPDLVE